MDTHYYLQEIEFMWDSAKGELNWHKHNIHFETASEVFFDPFLVALDDEITVDEERHTVIGLTTQWQLLYVVYVWRGETIRLISARTATSHERKIYEHGTA